MEKVRKNYLYIYAVKCLAVLLVINSHMDNIYPVSILAVGGALGNALFFFVSGYTWSNTHNKTFGEWYKQKLKRIYVPTILTNITYIVIFENIFQLKISDYFRLFIYPNKSWFCGAILVYAIIYYFIARKDNIKHILSALLILLVIYLIYYITILDTTSFNVESFITGGLCRFCFYAFCMFSGLLYRKSNKKSCGVGKGLCAILGIGMLIMSYLLKFIMVKSVELFQFQGLCQLLTLGSAFYLFKSLQVLEPRLNDLPGKKLIKLGAEYSWEIYLTQTLIIPFCVRIMFPMNVIVVVVGTLAFSVLLKKIVRIIQ